MKVDCSFLADSTAFWELELGAPETWPVWFEGPFRGRLGFFAPVSNGGASPRFTARLS
jgi:hypothetical protein